MSLSSCVIVNNWHLRSWLPTVLSVPDSLGMACNKLDNLCVLFSEPLILAWTLGFLIPLFFEDKPHLPRWLTIQAGKENVFYFFVSTLKPNLALGTRWTLRMLVWHMEQSEVARREVLAPSWLLRKGKGWDLHLDICHSVWTHSICALGQTVSVAGCPWGQWFPPLNLGQQFSWPFLALYPKEGRHVANHWETP